jgi:hypothetical protein
MSNSSQSGLKVLALAIVLVIVAYVLVNRLLLS